MLDDLSILEFEDIYDGAPAGSGLAHRVYMHNDVVAISEYPFDLATRAGKFIAQELDERL
jgi:hypothetical protein